MFFVTLAALDDAYNAKVSNWLLAWGLITGIAITLIVSTNAMCIKIYDYKSLLIRVGMIFVIMYLLYLMNVFGAGDAKLMIILGIFCEMREWFILFYISLCVSLVIGMVKRMRKDNSGIRYAVAVFIAMFVFNITTVLKANM